VRAKEPVQQVAGSYSAYQHGSTHHRGAESSDLQGYTAIGEHRGHVNQTTLHTHAYQRNGAHQYPKCPTTPGIGAAQAEEADVWWCRAESGSRSVGQQSKILWFFLENSCDYRQGDEQNESAENCIRRMPAKAGNQRMRQRRHNHRSRTNSDHR
jgi:hypothetical protein